MRKRFSNGFVVLVMLVSGISGVFASTAWANDIGFKVGYQHFEGIKAGIFYTFDLSDTVAIQPEVYYSQRKYEHGPAGWYDTVGTRYYDMVRFIEVPVLLKYKVKLRGDFKPVFFGGGYASFRLNRGSLMDNPHSFTLSWRRYADVDGGFVVGTGFEYSEGKVEYHFDVRGNFGIGWVQEQDPNILSFIDIPTIRNYNRSLSIMVGISF
jgi:hypothetical protein